jgi:glycerol-3-phosphate cytidylyltransferase
MIVGLVAGSFDVIHPGYIAMFKECKKHCDKLIVGLHTDPTIERPSKIKPVLTYEQRKDILISLRYVDEIHPYDTEADLLLLLKIIMPDIRFLGDDYRDKMYTGKELDIKTHFCDRTHGWSTTLFKNIIKQSI